MWIADVWFSVWLSFRHLWAPLKGDPKREIAIAAMLVLPPLVPPWGNSDVDGATA